MKGQNIHFVDYFDSSPNLRWKCQTLIGNASIDTFQFTCSSYAPIWPIDKNCAFFDVYHGGVKKGTNGNGIKESTDLIGPEISGNFTANSYVSFDYQFIKLRSAVISFAITDDNGKTWKKIWVDSIGQAQTKHVVLSLNGIVFGNSSLKWKFNWATSDTFINQGYVFMDNFTLFSKSPVDLGLLGENKKDIWCKNDSFELAYKLHNWGTKAIDTVIVNGIVRFNLSTYNLKPDTFYQLKQDEIRRLWIKKFSLQHIGQTQVSIFVKHKNDFNNKNDTLQISFNILDTLQTPSAINGIRCGTGTVQLNGFVASYDTLMWLSKSGKILGTGNKWNTPKLTKSDTFQLRSVQKTSAQLSSFQGPYRFNSSATGGSYIQITTKEAIKVTHLSQHFSSNNEKVDALIYTRKGGLKGKENDSVGWKLHHKQQITTKGWGNYVKMELPNLFLDAKDTVSIYITFVGKAGFTFKKGEFKTNDQVIQLYANGVNDKFFSAGGFFYNAYSWDGILGYETFCTSLPLPVHAVISPKPQNAALIPSQHFTGKSGEGSVTNPDENGLNHLVYYQINPPQGKKNDDFGINWQIQNIAVRNLLGGVVTKGIKIQLSSDLKTPPEIRIEGDSTWADSILTVFASVTDVSLNCDTILQRSFRFSHSPGAAFSTGITCINNEVKFINKTKRQNSTTYLWDYGDGYYDKAHTTQHTYFKNRNYTVRLIAANQFGVSDTFANTLTIQLYPRSSIRALHSCLGIPAEIQNISDNALITSSYYIWMYNGDTIHKADDIQPFKFKFDKAGIHKIKLVGNNLGCIDSTTKNVFQFENPVADFQYYGNCQFDTFKITNNSAIASKDKLGYRWLMNGQTFSTLSNPKGIITNHGTQEVMLVVTSEFNCADTQRHNVSIKPSVKSNFNVGVACKKDSTAFNNLTFNPSNLQTSYFWDFGDGNVSQVGQPKHFYVEVGEKKVQLKALAQNGCETKFDTTLVVRVHPDAQFDVDDACAGEQAIFLNKSKLENKILYYRWYFGDGDSSVIHSPTHIYRVNEATTYVVRLKVFTKDGLCSDAFAAPINILENPSCGFTVQRQSDSLTYRFFPVDSNITDFTWIFNGGGTSREANPIHKFQESKQVGVRLFGKNKYGCGCDSLQTVNVGNSSVSLHKLSAIQVYPNPFEKKVSIRHPNEVVTNINITDVTGRNIPFKYKQTAIDLIEIELSAGQVQGLFILYIETEEGSYNRVLVYR